MGREHAICIISLGEWTPLQAGHELLVANLPPDVIQWSRSGAPVNWVW